MTEAESGQNAGDAVAAVLGDLATVVAGLDEWQVIRDWALQGGAVNHIPPQLSGLDSYRSAATLLATDERLADLVNEESPGRPTLRVGLFGMQVRAWVLPAAMIGSAIVRACLLEPFTICPAPVVLRNVLVGNLDALRRIASGKAVVLTCLAGARGIRFWPGQASLETPLGTLHSKDAFYLPELAMTGNPDVLITTTIRSQVQLLSDTDGKWAADDPAIEAAMQRLSHFRLALLLGSTRAGQEDVPDWVRTTVTCLAVLILFAAPPGWTMLTVSGDPERGSKRVQTSLARSAAIWCRWSCI
jgi:hypothetical protein